MSSPSAPSSSQEDHTESVLLVDGHYLAHSSYYAFKENSLQVGGQATGALYGFLVQLATCINQYQPKKIFVAFDKGKKTFRHQTYPDYKGKRPPTPSELISQIAIIKQFLGALNLPILSSTEFEADDIIATLAEQAEQSGYHVNIFTGDRDYMQLVSDNTTLLLRKGRGSGASTRTEPYTPQRVEEDYGVPPARYVQMAALRGDTSDNIPGVPRVGDKTAIKLMTQYSSLENLLASADEVKGVVGESLRKNRDKVRLYEKLMTLVRTVPLDIDVESYVPQVPDVETFADLCQRYAIRKADIRRLPATLATYTCENGESLPDVDELVEETTVTVTQGEGQWAQPGGCAAWLRQHQDAAEQSTGDHSTDDISAAWSCIIHGSTQPGYGDIEWIVIGAPNGDALCVRTIDMSSEDDAVCAQWCADPTIPIIFHDAKSALHACHGQGWTVEGIVFDTQIAFSLLFPGNSHLDLADISKKQLDITLPVHRPVLTLFPDEEKGEGDENDHARKLTYSVAVLKQLAVSLKKDLEDKQQLEIFRSIELPLISMLYRMEDRGIAVSSQRIDEIKQALTAETQRYEEAAYEAVGKRDIKLNSPRQLQTILFEDLKLPHTRKTQRGYSTDADALMDLLERYQHPFLVALLQYRATNKLLSIVTTLENAVQDDERIHSTFTQSLTSTGRLSSKDPNLQNIPVRDSEQEPIRDIFVPGPGYDYLMTADYSQIEMRVMAHLSGDATLQEAFHSGEDLHTYVGSQAFGVPLDQVTPELRRRTKALSYGLAYGLSLYGLAKQLSISVEEAKDFQALYFARFGKVKNYLDHLVDKASEDGYTTTMYGRRRYLSGLHSSRNQERQAAKRAALNAPIQGSAADILKIAMVRVENELQQRQLRSRILLQIHDELVLEVVEEEREAVLECVTECMENAVSLDVPLEVSVGWGKSWHTAAH